MGLQIQALSPVHNCLFKIVLFSVIYSLVETWYLEAHYLNMRIL